MRKKKKKFKKSFIIIPLLLIIVVGVTIFFLSNKEEEYKDSLTINIGDSIPKSNDYFKRDINVKINWSNVDKYKVNTYKGIMSYKKHDYEVKLKVEDKTPPKIEGVKDITITVDDKVDLFKDIKITDDSKDKLSQDVEGKYDTKKAGTYNLKYIVKDKTNTTTKEFKLIVKEKPKEEPKPTEKTTTNSKTNNSNSSSNSSSANRTSSKGYKVEKRDGIYYVNGILIANKSFPLPSNYNPGGLLKVFTSNFNKMKNDAAKQGVSLRIISGFRSYSTQQTIYNNYVARDGKAAADRYSARAGHSEHQTGLAADINSLNQSFVNTKEGKWLNSNCYKYGFVIRYTKNGEGETGYMYEPWHIRYLGNDLAKTLYNNGNWITLENHLGISSKY